MPAQQCASEMANLRRAQSGPLNAVMVQGRETVNTEASVSPELCRNGLVSLTIELVGAGIQLA